MAKSVHIEIPERCLLEQAARWFVNGTTPIPDEIYEDDDPSKLRYSEAEIRPLFHLLRQHDFDLRGDYKIGYHEEASHMGDEGIEDWEIQFEVPFVERRDVPVPIQKIKRKHIDFSRSIILHSYVKLSSENRSLVDVELKRFDNPKSITESYVIRPDVNYFFEGVTINFKKLIEIYRSGSFTSVNGENDLSYKLSSSANDRLPYLKFMLKAANELKLSSKDRIPHKEIKYWLSENWPAELGTKSERKIQYMATFLRHPKDETGGFIK